MAVVMVILACVALRFEIRAMRKLHRDGLQQAQIAFAEPATSDLNDLVADAAGEIAELCELRACWFELFPFATLLPRIEPGRILLPPDEPGVAPLSYLAVELPVRLNSLTLGRFVLQPHAPTVGVMFRPTAREQAITIAARLAGPLAGALVSGERPQAPSTLQ